MKRRRPRSLKRRLIVQLLLFHIVVLFMFGLAFVAFLIRADTGGALVDPQITDIAARAIARRPDGRLELRETDEMRALRAAVPDYWFVARSGRGEIIQAGVVPEPYRALGRQLDRVGFADIRDLGEPSELSAVIRKADGPAGRFTVLGEGRLFSLTFVVLFLSNLLMIPILALLAVITVIAIPWIVSRAFAGMATVAREAELIDTDRRGYRLAEENIPAEVIPLVRAINGALHRLDEGYDRHQRFVVDAAHELRTPIAILQAKIEGLDDARIVNRLGRDVGRLGTLAEQLVDLQRIDKGVSLSRGVDLGLIAQTVAADLAPILIANGCEVEVIDLGNAPVWGDAGAIERILCNLVRNAIEHGGDHVVIRVQGCAVEVEDNGPGIPDHERERIFEPFYRLRARSTGAGLGLNLVRQVMNRHHGRIEVSDAPDGGATMRLEFLAATRSLPA
ncbi:sensor histidine kinase [Sphingomonas colocasiae]|uniref:histidine kinase n=1 Tax=Sphingomonas colocasiae TaxID=1848973 RepID=A0ABS7PKX7_9SPHN|nr:HAMP domain-containing sensor histidine kinase [Sphingomonas colocasiae]MBY8821945.1 HAMP domain-containing histidine kinase [Sphingomonas colocasiae]